MKAHQIEHQNQNIKKASAHLWWMRLQEKKYYDQVKNIISKTSKENDLVLLHDMQDETSYLTFIKMKFWWSGLYHIQEVISDKDSYFLEELNDTLKKNSVHDNRLKKFWLQDSCFDILKNNNVSKNNDCNLDINILENRENNRD